MERFSYKGGCDIRECIHIEAFKRRAELGKWLWLIINTILFKTVIRVRILRIKLFLI